MVIVSREPGPDFWAAGALPLAMAMDLALGHPPRWPEPSRALGRLASGSARAIGIVLARVGGGPKAESIAGVVLATVVVGVAASLAQLAADLADAIGGPASTVGRAILIYWGLAIRSTCAGPPLDPGPTGGSGRVKRLGSDLVDLIVGPMSWAAIGGPAGLWAFKAARTLGDLVRRQAAGSRPAARTPATLDALARFVPDRLARGLIASAAALIGEDGAGALRAADPLIGAIGGPGPVDPSTVRRAVRVARVVAIMAAGSASVAYFLIYA